jgi:hypothetical protein
MSVNKSNRGGKRNGAGRKTIGEKPKVAYSTKLSAEVVRYLKNTENAAKTIESALVRSAAFRRFQKTL